MSGHYAKDTSVSVERSRAELETLLRKYGGTAFAYAVDDVRAMIGFRIKTPESVSLAVRVVLPLPDAADDKFKRSAVRSMWRTTEQAHAAWEQECRSLWRALLLVVKAKLEACAINISTVEREFMADIVMPNGQTLTEMMGPQIQKMLETDDRKPLLLTAV